MPRNLRSLFAKQLEIQTRMHNFVSALESRLMDNGLWSLSPAQPTTTPYEYTDPDTGELVRLWRTPEDEVRQEEYQKYRLVLKRGIKGVMDPDLFRSIDKDQSPQLVRSYNMLRMISRAYTNLVCGNGIELKVGLDAVDEVIKEIRLSRDLRRWIFEASVFGFVGVETMFDPEMESVNIVRVLPDYLYPVHDSTETDKLLYVAKKTMIPLEQIPEWDPVGLEAESAAGVRKNKNTKANKRKQSVIDKHHPTNELVQDGFILEERHFPGWVEHYFYAVSGSRIICDVPLEVYDENLARQPLQLTGMRSHAIQILGNTNDEGEWTSDWKDLLDPVVDFCTRATKNGRLVDRFSAPRELVPQTMVSVDPFTGKVNYRLSPEDVVIVRPTDKVKPEFIQPSADFSGPEGDLAFIRTMIAILSEMGHVIDPELKERLVTGVALKLHMAPALARIAPRVEEQQDTVRRILWNVLSAIEYISSNRIEDEGLSDVQREAKINAQFAGLLSDAARDILEKGGLGEGNHFNLDAFRPLFTHLKLDDTMGGRYPQKGITFADPEQAIVSGNEIAMPPVNIYGNTVSRVFPDVMGAADVNKALDSMNVTESVLREADIIVKFSSGIPQDEAQAADEVQSEMMSLKRYLVEYKHMTEEEALEEIRLIREQSESAMPASDYGVTGTTAHEEPDLDAEFQEAQSQMLLEDARTEIGFEEARAGNQGILEDPLADASTPNLSQT